MIKTHVIFHLQTDLWGKTTGTRFIYIFAQTQIVNKYIYMKPVPVGKTLFFTFHTCINYQFEIKKNIYFMQIISYFILFLLGQCWNKILLKSENVQSLKFRYTKCISVNNHDIGHCKCLDKGFQMHITFLGFTYFEKIMYRPDYLPKTLTFEWKFLFKTTYTFELIILFQVI